MAGHERMRAHPHYATRRDNLDLFRRNGFDFRDDPASGRLLLSAVPFRCSAPSATLFLMALSRSLGRHAAPRATPR